MRISRFFLAALVLCLVQLLPGPAIAQTTGGSSKLPLWVAKGQSNTVHFLGSVHFLKRDFYPLPEPIEQTYTNAEIVMFEVDIARMRNPAFSQKVLADGTFPAGKTIAEEISQETYERLQEALKKKLGQGKLLDRFKPYMAALTLSVLELQRLGFRSDDGVDQYIYRKATRDKKEIRALETAEDQMSVFTTMNREEQEALLLTSLEEMNQIETMFGDIIAAWKSGDAMKLDTLIKDSMKEHPKLMEKLFADRNQKWVAQIEPLLQGDKNVLVIVGVGHLVGKDSVVEMLQQKGIKVGQVSAP